MPTSRRARSERPHVLILVQNLPVPFDRRVWQEALALVAAGYQVHVVCPRTREHPLRRETISGVRIYRYRPGPEARRLAGYLVEYAVAIGAQLRLALTIRARYRIGIVQICNPPDLLFLAALPLVALGSRLIYDHHDACPELMIAKGHREDGRAFRLARLLERLTYRCADVSIETNESYRDIALGRGGMSREDVFVVRSAPEITRFTGARPDEKWRRGRRYLVSYVGVMGRQDGLDYLIEAARMIVVELLRPDIQFVLVGSGPELPRLRERVRSLGLDDQVVLTGRLSDEDLGTVLATADVCVNPDEANRMNDISTMNKIMEYMALAKPIVQFDLHEGRVSAGDASLYAMRNDAVSLGKCIVELIDDPEERTRMGQLGARRLRSSLSWESQVPRLLAAYKRAAAKRRSHRLRLSGRRLGRFRRPGLGDLARKAGHQAGPDPDERLRLVGRHRHRQQVTLPEPATHRDQQVPLDLALDPLGDDLEPERPRDLDNALGQRQALLGDGDPVHERLVQLHHVDRQLPQVTEGGVPGAEVVDGQPHPDGLQLGQVGHHSLVPPQQHALGQLEHERAGLETRRVEDPAHAVHETGRAELPGRNIHADVQTTRDPAVIGSPALA